MVRLILGTAYLKSKIVTFPLLVHLFVTDRCNLSCDYCYSKDDSPNPDFDELKQRIDHAVDLGTVILAFMGGEPTLRSDLEELIAYANGKSVVTYVTSNASLLTEERLMDLGEAGLDVLELSVDGYYKIPGSDKYLDGNEELLDKLDQLRQSYDIFCKFHQVLTESTIDQTRLLVELANERRIPISFGLACEPCQLESSESYQERLLRTLSYLVEEKKKGSLIMNPKTYFEEAKRWVNNPFQWQCDVGHYSIQVATDGRVYGCQKIPSSLTDLRFEDIGVEYFRDRKHDRSFLPGCQRWCFSSCAYGFSNYRRNPLDLFSIRSL